jgi:hypothetical protein
MVNDKKKIDLLILIQNKSRGMTYTRVTSFKMAWLILGMWTDVTSL